MVQVDVSASTIPRTNLPWGESPFFERELDRRRPHLSAVTLDRAIQFHRDGFLQLPQAVPAELVDRVRRQVEPIYENSDIATVIDRPPEQGGRKAWRGAYR